MLHPVEILPGARRSVRRAVGLEAELIARSWEAPRRHRVLDLSPEGLAVAAGTLLEVGEHVIVCFTPPGWWVLGEIVTWARVARAEPRHDGALATMALELIDLPAGAREALARALEGRPPPLPRGRARHDRRALVWLDTLVTYGDADAELREPSIDDAALAPLGALLTGGSGPYRWQHV